MKPVQDATSFDRIDDDAMRARSVRLRFSQQMSYGIGAAMVFGLISVLAKGFFDAAVAAAGTTAAVLPVVGLVGIAAVGIGCIYLSAKYLTDTVQSEQLLQAKRIGEATRSRANSLQPGLEPKPVQFPASTQALTDEVPEKKWAETVAPRAELARAESATNDKSWAERARMDEQPTVARSA